MSKKINKCKFCGCTDDHACVGGCYWVDEEKTVCSACIEELIEDYTSKIKENAALKKRNLECGSLQVELDCVKGERDYLVKSNADLRKWLAVADKALKMFVEDEVKEVYKQVSLHDVLTELKISELEYMKDIAINLKRYWRQRAASELRSGVAI